MHNGTTILDEYGHNLDRLKVGAIFYFYFYFFGAKVLILLSLPSHRRVIQSA